MLLLSTLLVGALGLAAASPEGGFVRYGITTHEKRGGLSTVKRQDTVQLTNEIERAYVIELGIGTPPQTVHLQLDTGSSNLWVNPNCSTVSLGESLCSSYPNFDADKSSTFKTLDSGLNLTYGGGSAIVNWAADSVTVGSATLKAQQLGISNDSIGMTFGVLGLAPLMSSSPSQLNYTLFVDNLADQGVTASRAFSLDLQTNGSTDSSIIFGGVDTGKYIGALQKVPMLPTSETVALGGDRYWITIDSVSLKANGSTKTISSAPLTGVPDSGTSYLYVSEDLFTAVGKEFPTAKLEQSSGSSTYAVDCSLAQQPGSLDFKFGNKTIQIMYSDFVVPLGTNTCMLGIQVLPSNIPAGTTILGDVFLRAAYVVYDQDNRNVHLAEAANCGTNVIKIGSGPNAVPSATGMCKATSGATSTANSTSPPATSTPMITSGAGKIVASAGLCLAIVVAAGALL